MNHIKGATPMRETRNRKPKNMKKAVLTLPTVHMNGTSHNDLWQGYEAAYEAVQAAQEAIGKIEFNARDYYVQSDDAFPKARNQRQEMWAALKKVEVYLFSHLISLQEQKR
jgi:hypothetical protein